MTHFSILIHNIDFAFPIGKMLFNRLSLAFPQRKIGLVGRNGLGKSTLLRLIIGELQPHAGSIQVEGTLAYVPQNTSASAHVTIAEFLGCEDKISALHRIKEGSIQEEDYCILDEDWEVEQRLHEQLSQFGLNTLPYNQPLPKLSGGELTRLMLSKAFLSSADFLLLDEPTNHLDYTARQQLYQTIRDWPGGLIIVSHDRKLLNLMEEIVELTSLGAFSYGGNYEAFIQQKFIEQVAREQQLQDAQKSIEKAKNSVQSSREKHEQKQAYGRQLRRSGSIDKMTANSKKGRSERTQSQLLIKEKRMIRQVETELQAAKEKLEMTEEIKVNLPETYVPQGKLVLHAENISFSYPNSKNRLINNFDLLIQGPERVALVGDNGSGKTTLIKLILREARPLNGNIYFGTNHISYLDQHGSLLKPTYSILENFLSLNPDAKENDAYRCLAKFLFKNVTAHKLVNELSGGEKLRALLACILMSKHPPQLLILDEPVNHLDMYSIASIESALKNYQGAMIVVSHDQQFLENIGITRYIHAPFGDKKI